MAEITAARPVSGQSIESSWGQQIHDAVLTGAELASVEITAAVSISATTEATANPIMTAPAAVVGARGIEVEVFASAIIPPATQGAVMSLYLFQDGASIGRIAQESGRGAGNQHSALSMRVRIPAALTPAGSHVYSLRGTVASGSGSFYSGSTPGVVPSYMKIRAA